MTQQKITEMTRCIGFLEGIFEGLEIKGGTSVCTYDTFQRIYDILEDEEITK